MVYFSFIKLAKKMILMMNFNLGFVVSCQTGLEGLNTLVSDILMECFFYSPENIICIDL